MVNALKNVNFPFELCNRYPDCSVNNCPLDPVYPNRYVDPNDLEKKCGYAKSYRVQIAEQFPGRLKYAGLTIMEHRAKQRWENMSQEQRQIQLRRIAEINAKRWGYSLDQSDLRDVSEDTVE